jgi:hypothetical protein
LRGSDGGRGVDIREEGRGTDRDGAERETRGWRRRQRWTTLMTHVRSTDGGQI